MPESDRQRPLALVFLFPLCPSWLIPAFLGFAGMLPLQRSLQVFHLFLDLQPALLGVEENVVRVAVLPVPIIVQALEAGCIFLLEVLQALRQLIVGLSAGVFHGDP